MNRRQRGEIVGYPFRDARPRFAVDVGPLSFERGAFPPFDRLLGIEGTLTINVAGRIWFHQPSFAVIEFAAAISRWLARGGDFVFDTMEAEESPFWVRADQGGCIVGAAWQAFPIKEPLPCDLVRQSLSDFARAIVFSTREQLQTEVGDLIALRRIRNDPQNTKGTGICRSSISGNYTGRIRSSA